MNTDTQPGLPPEPRTRDISPAPEDYEGASPPRHFTWPLAWMLAAMLLAGALLAQAWPVFGH